MILHAVLPDLNTFNPEELKALIVAQHAQILSQDEEPLSKDAQLLRKEDRDSKTQRPEPGSVPARGALANR